MCDSVLVNGVVCETVRELCDASGICKHQLWICMKIRNIHMDSCLCPIDIRKTAKKNGYTADVYYDAVADWKMEKITAPVAGSPASTPTS